MTVDLAALNNGALNSSIFSKLPALPVGSYKQICLLFVSADDMLTTAALSTLDSSSTALHYNDQVEYADSTGVIHEAPLEIAYPTQGIQLNGTFDISATKPLNLAIDFDLDKIVVPFKHDGMNAFTMRPILRYFDLDDTGAIVGKIDTTNLCQSSSTTNCAYNLIVKAERLTADGTCHFDARATTVKSDGSFTLYPLPAHDSNGTALIYDVLVRGRQMDTNLILGVNVTTGTTPGSSPTQLQSNSIPITINTAEYNAQFSAALGPLTSGYAIFQQTLKASDVPDHMGTVTVPVPYEIRWDNTDPFTGLLFNRLASNGGDALATGPIHLAAYANGAALSFNPVTAAEGLGGYSAAANETVSAYFNLSTDTPLSAPSSGTTQTFTPPTPTLVTSVASGTVSGTIAVGTNSAGYDHGELVVVRFANIVTSDTTDVTNALANKGGTFTVSNLPAGSVSAAVPGAYYYAYLRLWKAGAHQHAKIIPIDGMIDLRSTSTASGINVTIP